MFTGSLVEPVMTRSHNCIIRLKQSGLPARSAILLLGFVMFTLSAAAFQAHADEVEKVLFLVFEGREVVASNTKASRFDRLKMHAKERIRDYEVANATAVVITNQRFAAYGVFAGGWQSKRIRAGEKLESMQVEDYSATLVTSDRILNFYGRNGTWSETRRGLK